MNGTNTAEAGASSCRLVLPADFRLDDFLAFHRRDTQQVAEAVVEAPAGSAAPESSLRKGLVWAGFAACLELRFVAGTVEARLAVDGPPAAGAALATRVRRMLGLDQPVAECAARFADHPELGPLLAARPGLRVPQTATPFEALAWAIIGQQISLPAAVAQRRKLILAVGCRHGSGIACFPDAPRLASLVADDLRGLGFSGAKARCLLGLSRAVAAGELPLDAWRAAPDAGLIGERLLAVPGIGPWTVDYALLRGFGWLDGSLHGDAAVRRALQALLAAEAIPGPAAARRWLAQFAPWRALAAAHLWASRGLVAT